MRHPFIHDLSDKTVDELQTTISGLMTKLSFAYRTNNVSLVNQLNMVLESYKEEYKKKLDDLVEKQNINSKIQITKEKL
jgi:hypothetical protein